MIHTKLVLSVAAVATIGASGICAGDDQRAAVDTAACAVETASVPLPQQIRESSGIARTADGGLWTHNDGAEGRVYRVTDGGAIEQIVALDGVRATDIEDIDAGPCPGGAGECLWLADTGDNDGIRPSVALLVLPVPQPGDQRATAQALPFRYPSGPRDAEALAVTPEGDAVLITKGRGTPIELYRLRTPGVDGATGPELLAQLAPVPQRTTGRVTGMGASETGTWIAARSNVTLSVHRADALLAGDATPALEYDLRGLRETQGEGVDITDDGRVWLTSEGEGGGTPTLSRLRCELPG